MAGPNGTFWDLAVIGGGINGAGIARDAAGRGLSVLLLERGDLAGATSSASTKLVHGGLRYLEQGAFRLVRESLAEREALLRIAPHLVHPLRFVLPLDRGRRPAWMIGVGLWLYDHLGGQRSLPASARVDLARDPAGLALRAGLGRGFAYYDCRVDDARLVVANARDAARRGATVLTRTKLTWGERRDGLWHLRAGESVFAARALVNAAGPFVSDVLGGVLGYNNPRPIRRVKGSHLVVRRLFDGDSAYIFQNRDGRVCFAIPYEQDFTLIGTTDVDDDAEEPTVSPAEEKYLLEAVSAWLREPVQPQDIVWRFAGARPLLADGADAQKATRDYTLELDANGPPLLSVFGGKLTTYRHLAETAMGRLSPFFPGLRGVWTGTAALPGGDFAPGDDAAVQATLVARYPFLSQPLAARLVRAYGTEAEQMLGDARDMAGLGRDFGEGLTERELTWMVDQEWARTADDVLWRRSKLGLRLGADALAAWTA